MSSYSTFLFTFIVIITPMIITISSLDQQQHRFRRAFINFFSDVQQPQLTAKHGSSITIGSIQNNMTVKDTDPWLGMVKNQSSRIMQGGTDLVLTPVNWLTNVTNNWYIKIFIWFCLFSNNLIFFVYL